MIIHVQQVEHLGAYRLTLQFNTGEWRTLDLEDHLWGPVFQPVRDPQVFQQVRVDADAQTIVWPNGADFAPEFLYQHSTPGNPTIA
jgi:hypothetical protein